MDLPIWKPLEVTRSPDSHHERYCIFIQLCSGHSALAGREPLRSPIWANSQSLTALSWHCNILNTDTSSLWSPAFSVIPLCAWHTCRSFAAYTHCHQPLSSNCRDQRPTEDCYRNRSTSKKWVTVNDIKCILITDSEENVMGSGISG